MAKVLQVYILPAREAQEMMFRKFVRTYDVLARGKRVRPHLGVYLPDVRTLWSILSLERRRLLELILEHRPRSIYELARISGRDYKNVYTDVKILARHGFLETRRNAAGKRTRTKPIVPYEKIRVAVHPHTVEIFLTEECSCRARGSK